MNINLRSSKLIVLIGFILTAGLTVVAFHDVINHTFLFWDDTDYILKNTILHSLSISNLKEMFFGHAVFNWHPVTWLSYALNFSLWGFSPVSFKITNIVLHLLNAMMVYLLLCRLFEAREIRATNKNQTGGYFKTGAALLAALFFAIHPLHVESVVWISGRKDLLCTFFYLLSIIFYLKQTTVENNRRWALLTVIAFVLALMSKSMAVTLPVVLLLLDIFVLERISNVSTFSQKTLLLFKNKIAIIIIAACVSVITVFAQKMQIQSFSEVGAVSRLVNFAESVLHYLGSIFYPLNLYPYYPFSELSLKPSLYSLVPLLILFGVIALPVYLYWKGNKTPLLVLLCFLVILLPVSGIVHVGRAAAADRYAYLPTISIFIFLGIAVARLYLYFQSSKIASTLVTIMVVGSVTGLVYVTDSYCSTWRNDQTLWEPVIARYPDNVMVAYQNTGNWYMMGGQFEIAIKQFEKALKINPDNTDIMGNIGKSYAKMGALSKAMTMFSRVIKTAPESTKGYIMAGDLYYQQKMLTDAEQYYSMAYQVNPNSIDALSRVATMEYYKGNIENALIKLNLLFEQTPDDLGGLQLAALISLKRENVDKALLLARRILKQKPDNPIAINIIRQYAKTD